MTLAVWFWIIYVLSLIFTGIGVYRTDPVNRLWGGLSGLVLWVLLFIIGLKLFGSPIAGG